MGLSSAADSGRSLARPTRLADTAAPMGTSEGFASAAGHWRSESEQA